MLRRFEYSILLLLRLLVLLLCAACLVGVLGQKFGFLLNLSRTSGVVLLAFLLVYLLMTRVYGGFDIGKRKSKPIIFSLALTVLCADLASHLFLCIMNVTVVNQGRFVYEAPLLLLAAYLLQVVVIAAAAYLCNGIYFRFHKPLKCLVVTRRGEQVENLVRRVGRLKKQYAVDEIAYVDQKDLLQRVDDHEAVFIYNLASSEREFLIEYCYQQEKELFYSVEMTDIVALGGSRVLFDDKSMIHAPVKGLTFEQRILKRGMDLAVAGLGLLVTSPLFLITAIAIKLDDGGPVFYSQKRMTYAGRSFDVLKFRSMKVGSAENRSATKNDDRITRVGRIIRKFRIDELPQLINVLRSDMSIVGPRPEIVANVQKFTKELPEFAYRLRAKAGLTGLAQIYGRYNTSAKDKLIMDLTYIANYSVWLDIKLILCTVLVLLTPSESTEGFDAGKQPMVQPDGQEEK